MILFDTIQLTTIDYNTYVLFLPPSRSIWWPTAKTSTSPPFTVIVGPLTVAFFVRVVHGEINLGFDSFNFWIWTYSSSYIALSSTSVGSHYQPIKIFPQLSESWHSWLLIVLLECVRVTKGMKTVEPRDNWMANFKSQRIRSLIASFIRHSGPP